MMLRKLLEKERRRLSVPWSVLEQDYVLSWVLWGLSSVDVLRESLVFKGGTALKKIYFGDYRFSQDLDFTALDTAPHPEDQEAFVIRAKLPWHRRPQVRIMVEITRKELIISTPLLKPVRHDYDENLNCSVLAYSLEEIIAEKLRAILQNAKKYHEQGWSRSRARDYYDIWCILKRYGSTLKSEEIPNIFKKKCSSKFVKHESHEAFFDKDLMVRVRRDWSQWLEPLVYDLPEIDIVLEDLEKSLRDILKT